MHRLTVAGIGPGSLEHMTALCRKRLEAADVIIGYTGYVALIQDAFSDKVFMDTPMRKEVDRCRMALDMAQSGKDVCLVCSGDSGVYGMAGLVYELSGEYPAAKVEIVPGVTAALSGGAILGAPLGHDFAVISLSDLLTPWELIEKRLRLASEADLAISLYNPSSQKRHDYLARACEIMLFHKAPETLCGIARNIGREGEAYELMTLIELKDATVDMFTTVFIGNTRTREIAGHMVTPRGYRDV